MNCIHILESPKDIALAFLLLKTAPVPLKIVITTFTASDKYGWKKPKNIVPSFPNEEIEKLKAAMGDRLVIAATEKELDDIWGSADICMSRGREFVVLKSKAKKNVALSLTGSYFTRLYMALPFYENMKILFLSEEWATDDNLMNLDDYSYDDIKKIRPCFDYGDIYGYYYDYMKECGKEKIKNEIGLPLDQKIAFLSFRRAAPLESIYKDNEEFMFSIKRMIKKFKDDGYYIISRRRLGSHDLQYYNAMNCPEVKRFKEVEHLIDREMNGFGEFPYDIWKGLYSSDILLLTDNSGICYIEAAISRCPIYMPYSKEALSRVYKELLPASRDMFDQNLIFNDYCKENVENYRNNIEAFLSKWYNYDVEKFWERILA